MLARMLFFEQCVGAPQVLGEQVGGGEPCFDTSLALVATKRRASTLPERTQHIQSQRRPELSLGYVGDGQTLKCLLPINP